MGMPSRQTLINEIKLVNFHIVPGYPEISQLYNLIEHEESPFTIAKQGMKALESTLAKNEDLIQYAHFIKKALAVRILQKMKNYYRNLKF